MVELVVLGKYHTSIVLECVLNNLALELHLIRIRDVLQLTSGAFRKVFAKNVLLWQPVWSRFYDLNKICMRIAPMD